MIEYRDDGGDTPCLMEINGRFWGSLQLGVDAGIDFPLRWVWGDVKRILYIAAGRPRGYSGPFPTLREGIAEVFGPQPDSTSLETWRPGDRWPAVGEVAQGLRELVAKVFEDR